MAVGLSEPNSGSDLASVQTRATLTTNGWKIRGTKVWTTNAHRSHYIVVLARSSGETGDRHRGLSQFVVDLKSPGIEIRPIKDLNGHTHFNEIYFDDVQIPADALVGSEGAGWEQVNAELAYERCGPERLLSSIVLVDEWIDWLRSTGEVSDESYGVLGRIAAQLAVLRNVSISVTGLLVAGQNPSVEAALIKDLGTAVNAG